MRDLYWHLSESLLALVAPNTVLTFALFFSVLYFQAESPTWRNVAAGAISLVGILAGLGYRDFLKKLKEYEAQMKDERDRRDKQHAANQAAIIALALAGGEKERVEAVIAQLLKGM